MTVHHLIPNASPQANRFSKTRRPFLEPFRIRRIIRISRNRRHQQRQPGAAIARDRAGRGRNRAVRGQARLPVIGDSGGIHGDDVQVAVAEAMEDQIKAASKANKPAFLYHVGDVVYFNGQSESYGAQFYEPYEYYPAPIFAIPATMTATPGFARATRPIRSRRCSGSPRISARLEPHQISAYRSTMTQPYVYWTLDAPLVSIIGLYSNVEGTLDARGTFEQQRWLEQQLTSAKSKDGFIVVAVHHPPYSLDKTHGGYADIVVALDQSMESTGVIPHAVLSGHVHNMQRFSRSSQGREIPYVIDGRGGYADTDRLAHKMQKDGDGEYPKMGVKAKSEQDPNLDLKLDYYDQDSAGFLRVTVTKTESTIDSFSVPFDGAFEDTVRDSVTVNRDGSLGGSRARGQGGGRRR